MSFGDHAVLWLHVTAAVFTIGPGTAAIMSTPRYIRNRNTVIVGFLHRTTRIYSFGSLLTLIFGLILTGMMHKFSQWWISVSLTLFIVAFVLLMLILRDQRKALGALHAADVSPAGVSEGTVRSVEDSSEEPSGAEPAPGGQQPVKPAADLAVAAVERGRIASLGGVTALVWLVILVLMVWH
jgi:hypothetical protein